MGKFQVDDEVRVIRGRLSGRKGIIINVDGRFVTVKTGAGIAILHFTDVEAV